MYLSLLKNTGRILLPAIVLTTLLFAGCETQMQLSIPTAPRNGLDANHNGIADDWEEYWHLDSTDPELANRDPDGDGLSNKEEYDLDTNPNKADSDGDGIPDGWEVEHGMDPNNPLDGGGDYDQDGLTNKEESIYNTDPRKKDTDGDGWDDKWEVVHGTDPTNPNDPDRDGDGLPDAAEAVIGTNPDLADTDGDQYADGWEVQHGYDPLDNDDPGDYDGDGFPDDWEREYGYDPANPLDPDPNGDDDNDGISNRDELNGGTNPKDDDSDDDGIPDKWEKDHGLDPRDGADGDEDPDNDGLSNEGEYTAGTDLSNPDTDDDGLPDGWELTNDFDPLDATDGGPVYVTAPPLGNDNSNGTETAPYRTLKKAVWKAKAALDEARRTVIVVGPISEESGGGDALDTNDVLNIFNITDTGPEGITITGAGVNPSLTKTSGIGLYGASSGVLSLGPETRVTLTNITITAGGHPGRGITLNGGNLTLGNGCKVINNTNPYPDDEKGGGGIYAAPGSLLTLEAGCEVSGNTVKGSTRGAGISMKAATLVMNGGFIKDNLWTDRISGLEGGSGVFLESSSTTFTMNGGEISGNIGRYGGGVNAIGQSSVIMAGGLITGNTALISGGGIRVGPFIMKTGAAITNNEAIGEGGSGYSGGIEICGVAVMDGGSISGNRARDEGGGVRVTFSTSSFTMNGGDITGNEVTNGYAGGGVSAMNAAFIMHGGVIAKNTVTPRAEAWTGKGGGVCASNFTMTGGTIYGSDNTENNANEAAQDGYGHAVYIFTYSGNVSGFNNSLLTSDANVAKDNTVTSYP